MADKDKPPLFINVNIVQNTHSARNRVNDGIATGAEWWMHYAPGVASACNRTMIWIMKLTKHAFIDAVRLTARTMSCVGPRGVRAGS